MHNTGPETLESEQQFQARPCACLAQVLASTASLAHLGSRSTYAITSSKDAGLRQLILGSGVYTVGGLGF